MTVETTQLLDSLNREYDVTNLLIFDTEKNQCLTCMRVNYIEGRNPGIPAVRTGYELIEGIRRAEQQIASRQEAVRQMKVALCNGPLPEGE